ncbi:hypothetical protein KQX54_021813 [Cotesia glomerata]|uniref:Uncharacterized protein n=1 Tax=Cotesia glomerata TaxID=32391 RepID=A0AAV7J7Q4_COTGL|nr:hypothetical protein KQX54_021813 [Cotesia glomerata]
MLAEEEEKADGDAGRSCEVRAELVGSISSSTNVRRKKQQACRDDSSRPIRETPWNRIRPTEFVLGFIFTPILPVAGTCTDVFIYYICDWVGKYSQLDRENVCHFEKEQRAFLRTRRPAVDRCHT